MKLSQTVDEVVIYISATFQNFATTCWVKAIFQSQKLKFSLFNRRDHCRREELTKKKGGKRKKIRNLIGNLAFQNRQKSAFQSNNFKLFIIVYDDLIYRLCVDVTHFSMETYGVKADVFKL